MNTNNRDKIIGYQRVCCKRPDCRYLLKKIYFSEAWEKTIGENGVDLMRNNGSSYYVCPSCKSKNFVAFEGDKIILEKIIRFETQQGYPNANEQSGDYREAVCFGNTMQTD